MKTIRSIPIGPNIYGYITGFRAPDRIVKPITKRSTPRKRLTLDCAFCSISFLVPPARMRSAKFCGVPCRTAYVQAKKRAASKARVEALK